MVYRKSSPTEADKSAGTSLKVLGYGSATVASIFSGLYLSNVLPVDPNFSRSWAQLASTSTNVIAALMVFEAGREVYNFLKYSRKLSDGSDRGLRA